MGVVKSLIGSVIGAAVAIGIYYGIKQSTGDTYVWFPLIIGLIVGITTRIASGGSLSAGSRVVAGALAALVAGLAMFGPDIVEGMPGNAEFGPIESTSDSLVNTTIAKDDADMNKDESGEDAVDSSDQSDAVNPSDDDENDSPSDDPTRDQDSTDDSGESSSDDGGNDESGDDDSGDGAGDESPSSDDSNDASTRGDKDVNQAFADRGNSEREVPRSAETIKKFEELIKKQKHKSWLQTLLPIICSGIGMVLAYVVGQSGSGPGISQ